MRLSRSKAESSFNGTVCPACGKSKKERHALCHWCREKLTLKRRKSLYWPIDEGFHKALSWALTDLGVEHPVLPARAGGPESRGQ